MSERLVLVICQHGACEEVVQHLEQAGVSRYTMHHGFFGSGETGRHEGTSVWPGDNTVIFCCVPEQQVPQIVDAMKALHNSRPGHTLGLKVFALPVDELL